LDRLGDRLGDRRADRLRASIGLVLLAVFAVVAAARAVDLWWRHNDILAASERHAEGLALIVEEHLRRSVAAVDAVLAQLALHATRIGGAMGDDDDWMPVLEASRAAHGHEVLEVGNGPLPPVIEAVAAMFLLPLTQRGLRLSLSLDPEADMARFDPLRLEQVLTNLVGNAVKFTPAGGAVTVRAARQGDQVWIAVEDSGVGIAKDELARIWDPFYQVESPMRRRHGGSGLGLAIVRRLVELHGGVVRAESDGENRGSRFSFSLPVSTVAPRSAVAVEETESRVEPVLAGREVLIVDDDLPNQDLMRTVVEDLLGGHATISADGEAAVQLALEHPPAVILLDLMLPGLSGWEVARRLRQHPDTRNIPIIAVSALARPQERESAFHAGCEAYVAKPYTPDDLARVVAATMAGAGALSR